MKLTSCITFEDSVEGIIAAKLAGIGCVVAVLTGSGNCEDFVTHASYKRHLDKMKITTVQSLYPTHIIGGLDEIIFGPNGLIIDGVGYSF
ncbi:MAG: hypothetical protein V1859_00015 [archaeon]